MTTYTITKFTYPCQHCRNIVKNTAKLYKCQRCGKYLCKKHEQNGLCPDCLKSVDIWVSNGIKSEIKKKNTRFWIILLSINMLSVIAFALSFGGYLGSSEAVSYIMITPFLSLLISLFVFFGHASRKYPTKIKIIQQKLRENNDFPFFAMFNVEITYVRDPNNITFNLGEKDAIKEKVLFIINTYGKQQLLESLVLFFKTNMIQNDFEIQRRIGQFFNALEINLQDV